MQKQGLVLYFYTKFYLVPELEENRNDRGAYIKHKCKRWPLKANTLLYWS